MSDQCEEVCNCLACANERQRSSIQDMFGSDRNAMDTLGESTRSLHGSPVCIRATLQAEKSKHATLNENASPESASSKAATLNGMSHSLRASCSPYIETVDMQAPVMESLIMPKSSLQVQGLSSVPEGHIKAPVPEDAIGDYICLSEHDLSDKDTEMIIDLLDAGNVKQLVLAKNSLGDHAAEEIANALKRNDTLEFLSLAGNHIGEAGGLALADALLVNTTLKSLFLSSNSLGKTATQALIDANAEKGSYAMTGLCGLVLGTPVE